MMRFVMYLALILVGVVFANTIRGWVPQLPQM